QRQIELCALHRHGGQSSRRRRKLHRRAIGNCLTRQFFSKSAIRASSSNGGEKTFGRREKEEITRILVISQSTMPRKFCSVPQQKVSRWRKALAGDLDEYRALLRGPSWRKAMGERDQFFQKLRTVNF